jgi:hypothetical protein
VTLRFAGVNDPDAPPHCESPPLTQSSRTIGVDATLAAVGPRLNRSPAQIEAEMAAARASPPRADEPPLDPIESSSPRKLESRFFRRWKEKRFKLSLE